MESTQADKVYINEGDHIDVEDTARLPYELLSVLGYGGSAVVEEVKDIYTQKVFARKVFRVLTRTLPQVREMFEKEIMIIRRLAPHPHIVKAFATYTTKRSLAVIIDPVADGGNLAELLAARRDCNQSDRLAYDRIIKTGFGCLAKGLAFIHSNSIRHKDIKPQNILVHQSRLLYTDFGISNDFSNSRSTTEGHPGPFTMRYCAPEVVDWGERNSKSDIFSLGCVFLEMYTDPSQDLEGPFHNRTNEIPAIFSDYMRRPASSTLPFHRTLGYIIERMMLKDAGRRISAEELVVWILSLPVFVDAASRGSFLWLLHGNITYLENYFCAGCAHEEYAKWASAENLTGLLHNFGMRSVNTSGPPRYLRLMISRDSKLRFWVIFSELDRAKIETLTIQARDRKRSFTPFDPVPLLIPRVPIHVIQAGRDDEDDE